MVFPQLFRSLEGHRIIVEMKNDMVLEGALQSSDQFGNLKLIEVVVKYQGLCRGVAPITSALIRGSYLRYVYLPKEEVDLDLLHDATRRHNQGIG
jgi:U6 snRNA-associated Sm-like protein LSm2